jgi:hypothetical protein
MLAAMFIKITGHFNQLIRGKVKIIQREIGGLSGLLPSS